MINVSKRNSIFLIILVVVYALSGCASVDQTRKQDDVSMATVNMEHQQGIRVVGVRPTAEGRMLNFRYKIIDAEKAASIISPMNKPYLIDQKTGTKFGVPNLPKVGALKQRGKKAYEDRIYFVLFANPGQMIKPGDSVTVVIGDFRKEDILVE